MLWDVVRELLHGVNSTSRWFGSRFPGEPIVFASPASYNEAERGARLGWGRRGVVILTLQQLFFKSTLLSLFTLIFLAVGFACFVAYARTEEIVFLMLGILAVAATFNRLPHERQIWLGDVEHVEFDAVRGLTLRGMQESPRLRISTQGHMVQFTLQQTLTDEARHILAVGGDATDQESFPQGSE